MGFWASLHQKKEITSKGKGALGVWPFSLAIPKALLGFLHLSLVLGGVCFLLLQHSLERQVAVESTVKDIVDHRHHVLLLELLDTYMRYEYYYKKLHGRFTYDLKNLSVFRSFSSTDLLYLEAVYEIYATRLDNGVFSICAISKNSHEKAKGKFVEKISVDEKFQVIANFPTPDLSRSYLKREAYRMMRQRSSGEEFVGGVSFSYLSLQNRGFSGGVEGYLYAEGLRAPIKGERYAIHDSHFPLAEYISDKEELSNSFSLALQANNLERDKISFSQKDFYSFLEEARFAQYVYTEETGRKANSWRELDLFFRFQFEYKANRVDNFSLEVISIDAGDTLLAIRGTKGALLGEYFSLGESGKLERLQYADVFIDEVQKSTNLLRGVQGDFQVKELGREPALDSSDF